MTAHVRTRSTPISPRHVIDLTTPARAYNPGAGFRPDLSEEARCAERPSMFQRFGMSTGHGGWILVASGAIGVSTYLLPIALSLIGGAFLLASTALGAYLAAKYKKPEPLQEMLTEAIEAVADLTAELAAERAKKGDPA